MCFTGISLPVHMVKYFGVRFGENSACDFGGAVENFGAKFRQRCGIISADHFGKVCGCRSDKFSAQLRQALVDEFGSNQTPKGRHKVGGGSGARGDLGVCLCPRRACAAGGAVPGPWSQVFGRPGSSASEDIAGHPTPTPPKPAAPRPFQEPTN